jgi:7,8-dihydroneopterin aldolase/epimerase/oxygenase
MSRIDPRSFDRILLEGLRFHGFVGVLAEEKRQGQEFRVDLELEFLRIPACDDDRLDHTVDYGLVFGTVRRVVESARFDLVERLAGEIAARVLEEHPTVLAATVTVRKPDAPVRGRFDAMGVSIRRERGPG